MERYECKAWLDWWANRSFRVSVEVAVSIAAIEEGEWDATGRILIADEDDLEGFEFFCQLEPVFTLRFEDGSTVDVVVEYVPGTGNFSLTEFLPVGAEA